jgi:hypothetical protein
MSTSTCLVTMCGILNKFCPIYCRAIAAAVAGVAPRVRPVSLAKDHMLLSGLEPLKVLPCNSTLFHTFKDDFFSLQNLRTEGTYFGLLWRFPSSESRE